MSEIEGEYTPVKDYSMGELEVRLRYAPNEKYYQSKSYRYPVSLDMPVFTLSHIVAHKGVMGSDYSYNCTEFGFQKRFWFLLRYTDVILRQEKFGIKFRSRYCLFRMRIFHIRFSRNRLPR